MGTYRKTLTKKQKIGLICLAGFISIFITFIILLSFNSLSQNISSLLGYASSIWKAVVLLSYSCLSIYIAFIGVIFNAANENNSKGNRRLRFIFEIILISISLCAILAINRFLLYLTFSILPTNILLTVYAFIIWGVQSYLTIFQWGWYEVGFIRNKRQKGDRNE